MIEAIDVEAWLDAKRWLLGCPKRLVQIAYKRYIGKPLDNKEQVYLHRLQAKRAKKVSKSLVLCDFSALFWNYIGRGKRYCQRFAE